MPGPWLSLLYGFGGPISQAGSFRVQTTLPSPSLFHWKLRPTIQIHRSSRREEAQTSRRTAAPILQNEPPHVGCYIFKQARASRNTTATEWT